MLADVNSVRGLAEVAVVDRLARVERVAHAQQALVADLLDVGTARAVESHTLAALSGRSAGGGQRGFGALKSGLEHGVGHLLQARNDERQRLQALGRSVRIVVLYKQQIQGMRCQNKLEILPIWLLSAALNSLTTAQNSSSSSAQQ